MKTLLSIIIFLIITTSCNSGNYKDGDLYKYRNEIRISNKLGINNDTLYFPFEVFRDSINRNAEWEIRMDTFDVNWFSQILYEMGEPILTDKYLDKEIYRMSLFRSFDPDIVVRIEKTNDSISLFEKTYFQFKSIGEDDIDENSDISIQCIHVVVDSSKITKSSKNLSTDVWNRLEDVVEKNKFHSMSTTVAMDFGPDGDIWLLEKYTKNGYYVVKRSSYGKGVDSLRNICNFLIETSDLKIRE